MPDTLPILQKPKMGEACNGCGLCCKRTACPISTIFLRSETAPCIALETDGSRYFCGMVRNPSFYTGLSPDYDEVLRPVYLKLLGGVGGICDTLDPGMTEAEAFLIMKKANRGAGG